MLYCIGIGFEYDSSSRLTRLKDPFGFVTNIDYDDADLGQLDTVEHSTLGEAAFTYDSHDRLSVLTLGNDAYTTYTYDAYGRLTAFDIKEDDDDRLLKHEWGYDALGRKTKPGPMDAGIVITSPYVPYDTLAITYDSASRLTREYLNGIGGDACDNEYGYDDVGNRTSFDDNDKIVTRYMDDKEFGSVASDVLSEAIYESLPVAEEGATAG